MRVHVLYFGVLRESTALPGETAELTPPATVGDLLRHLRAQPSNSQMEPLWDSLAVAVNRVYASADCVLHEDDEVALLPPVSGGRR